MRLIRLRNWGTPHSLLTIGHILSNTPDSKNDPNLQNGLDVVFTKLTTGPKILPQSEGAKEDFHICLCKNRSVCLIVVASFRQFSISLVFTPGIYIYLLNWLRIQHVMIFQGTIWALWHLVLWSWPWFKSWGWSWSTLTRKQEVRVIIFSDVTVTGITEDTSKSIFWNNWVVKDVYILRH